MKFNKASDPSSLEELRTSDGPSGSLSEEEQDEIIDYLTRDPEILEEGNENKAAGRIESEE